MNKQILTKGGNKLEAAHNKSFFMKVYYIGYSKPVLLF